MNPMAQPVKPTIITKLLPGLQVIVLGLLGCCLHAQIVEIPDPGLLAAIRLALNKPTGDITVAEMKTLTALDASLRTRGRYAPVIETLQGLEMASNLKNINFSGIAGDYYGVSIRNLASKIDLEPLTLLADLQQLNLSLNEFSRIQLSARLSRLTTLDLSVNHLFNLTLPTGLTNLTMLNLGHNELTSLTLPPGLTNLTTLDLRWNPLSSLTLPEGLSSLTTLNLGHNELTSLTLPDGLSRLRYLDVGGKFITELAMPVWIDLDRLSISGFPKDQVTFHAGTIRIQNGELHWTEGILEHKANLSDPWSALPASSPFPLSPIGEKGFFRVRWNQEGGDDSIAN